MFAKSMTLAKTDIERAFAKDEFVVLLQPQIDVADGSVVAAEAFVRWRHPDFGMMTPQLFLPFVDAQGEGARLLEVVVRRGIEAAQAFADAGRNWRVSINLGAADLQSGIAADIIGAALRACDMTGDDLILEAPETALVGSDPAVRETMERLRSLGCGLALDSGASLPLEAAETAGDLMTEIKIGGAAILRFAEIARKVNGGRIVRRLGFAKAHGLRSVAVGVESEKTLTALVKLGFCAVQGALIAKPSTLDDLLAWDGKWAGETSVEAALMPARPLRPRSRPRLVVPAPPPIAPEPPKLVERLGREAEVNDLVEHDPLALDVDFDEDGAEEAMMAESEADPSDDTVVDQEELMALEASGSLHSGMIERPRKAAAERAIAMPAFEPFDPEPPIMQTAPEPAFDRPLALRTKIAPRRSSFLDRLGLGRLLSR